MVSFFTLFQDWLSSTSRKLSLKCHTCSLLLLSLLHLSNSNLQCKHCVLPCSTQAVSRSVWRRRGWHAASWYVLFQTLWRETRGSPHHLPVPGQQPGRCTPEPEPDRQKNKRDLKLQQKGSCDWEQFSNVINPYISCFPHKAVPTMVCEWICGMYYGSSSFNSQSLGLVHKHHRGWHLTKIAEQIFS